MATKDSRIKMYLKDLSDYINGYEDKLEELRDLLYDMRVVVTDLTKTYEDKGE